MSSCGPAFFGSSIPTDPYFANVVLLLHGDGIGTPTVFTDSSNSAHVMTKFNDATLSAAQKKFGDASMLFDGTGDYLTTPVNTPATNDFNFGTGDYTLECWVRPATSGNMNIMTMSVIGALGSISDIGWYFEIAGADLYWWSYNSTTVYNTNSTGALVTSGSWHHVAAVKYSNNVSLFIDGNRVVNNGATMGVVHNYSTAWTTKISLFQPAATRYFNGYIDDLRITKGVARYTTATYTLPTRAFPNS